MSSPEKGTEFTTAQYRIRRRVMNTVLNVARIQEDLHSQVCVLIYDEVTKLRCGAFVDIQRSRDGRLKIKRTRIVKLARNVRVVNVADALLEHYPKTPLVCDKEISDELFQGQGSIPWLKADSYGLVGRPQGILEVYTPQYK